MAEHEVTDEWLDDFEKDAFQRGHAEGLKEGMRRAMEICNARASRKRLNWETQEGYSDRLHEANSCREALEREMEGK